MIAALETRYKLDSTFTRARDAGVEVARQAAADGNELVVAFGGDGLVNEVVNGIIGSESTLAIIPGGTMNVFARNIGIARDPLDAADRLLVSDLTTTSFRPAKVDDRYFTFACGCGFDAEAATKVESNKPAKRRIGEPYFYMAAMTTFLGSYFVKKPFLNVEVGGREIPAVMAIALNGETYAYLAGRPVKLAGPPKKRLRDGEVTEHLIELFTLKRLKYHHVPNYLLGAVLTGRFGPDADVTETSGPVVVSSDKPFSIHVDGEPLPPRSRAELSAGDAEISLVV